MPRLIVSAAVFAVTVGVLACSSSKTDGASSGKIPTDEAGGHTSPYPTCQIILDRCHELDVGEGAIHDCHEVAHDAKNDGECAAKKTACLALCVEEDAGKDGGHD